MVDVWEGYVGDGDVVVVFGCGGVGFFVGWGGGFWVGVEIYCD